MHTCLRMHTCLAPPDMVFFMYMYIWIKPFFHDFRHYHPYILQHFNGNVLLYIFWLLGFKFHYSIMVVYIALMRVTVQWSKHWHTCKLIGWLFLANKECLHNSHSANGQFTWFYLQHYEIVWRTLCKKGERFLGCQLILWLSSARKNLVTLLTSNKEARR